MSKVRRDFIIGISLLVFYSLLFLALLWRFISSILKVIGGGTFDPVNKILIFIISISFLILIIFLTIPILINPIKHYSLNGKLLILLNTIINQIKNRKENTKYNWYQKMIFKFLFNGEFRSKLYVVKENSENTFILQNNTYQVEVLDKVLSISANKVLILINNGYKNQVIIFLKSLLELYTFSLQSQSVSFDSRLYEEKLIETARLAESLDEIYMSNQNPESNFFNLITHPKFKIYLTVSIGFLLIPFFIIYPVFNSTASGVLTLISLVITLVLLFNKKR